MRKENCRQRRGEGTFDVAPPVHMGKSNDTIQGPVNIYLNLLII